MFFRQVGDRIELLAKASKANEDRVIKRLAELYKESSSASNRRHSLPGRVGRGRSRE